MIDHELIEKIKNVNKVSKVTHIEFLDANGKYATKTKKMFVTATIQFANGYKFKMNAETFNAFGDYGFHIGTDLQ